MKTCELTGAALDWAVAKCTPGALRNWPNYNYVPPFSSDWSYGGPITERLMALGAELRQGGPNAGNQRCWFKLDSQFLYSQGPTPLIAAMRCLVASELGGEVDVPKELL